MSETAGSTRGDAIPTAQSSGLGLYAASMRNLLPRLISAASVAAVAGCYLGWGWALAWSCCVWANLWASAVAMDAAARHKGTPWGRALTVAISASSFMASALQSVAAVALWRHGGDVPRAFAMVTVFIGAAYVLLQYYADLTVFRLLLVPYVVALAYVAWDAGAAAGWPPAVIVTVIASAVSLINFFFLSRRLLDRSRTALRQARQRAQQGELAAESANAAKSTFLATMSHEIRTPLNGVLGMAQAMAGDELSDRQRDRLSVVHRSGEALLAILNDVLDLSKIEAGKLELEQLEFELADVARGAYSAFTALANKKGLSFALDIEPARGRYLGDPTRLRQILYNLISNALKFTEQGEIRVTAVRRGEILELSVADTGVGIPPESLSRLFAKFDQLDSSTTRRFGGTGLGLAICRELAQLMAGEISVESELGLGSKFTLRAPLPWMGEEKAAVACVIEAPTETPDIALRVLAAEDNAVNQLVLKTLLHQMGVDPHVVDNGQQAVEAWESGEWDVILMDIQMPVMDGLTATAQIRNREADTGRPRTPIVALTANAMSHQVEQYILGGMDGHVAKPIQAVELFETLTRAAAPPQVKPGGGVKAEVA
ncbi:ATP-binding protein [Phenylobacterium sp.]|uniref:ATP-binding protein n=1 Tax=Phenylobacterium sp. TaxID=1871053 RepID=UPI003563FE4E